METERVQEDLRELLRGELLFDDLSQTLYSTDASIFQVRPLGAITPRDEADVQAVVRYAREHSLAIIGRGAGSGVAGESLGSGIVLDFARHFREILEVGTDSVRVQPGVVLDRVNEVLRPHGRRIGPDPASSAQCTLGGMAANNSSGSRALKHGYTRDHMLSVRLVLDTGDVAIFGRERVPTTIATEDRKHEIVRRTAQLLEINADLIEGYRPRTRFNRCGYQLHDIQGPDTIDFARLLTGTEGTLGLFTELTLRTVPLPAERRVVLFGFASLESAAHAANLCLAENPSACELVDRRLLSLTRSRYPEYHAAIQANTEAVLLLEFESAEPGEARQSALQSLRRMRSATQLTQALLASDDRQADWLWRLRSLALPLLHAMPGKSAPIPFIEDVAVPVENLAAYLHRVQGVLRNREITASFLVHAGAGQVHTRPFLDLRDAQNVENLRQLADEVYRIALDLGGTISTQHAVGLARTPWVAQQYGRLYPVFRDLKAIFDPKDMFNPGKIVTNLSDPLAHLRRDPTAKPLDWQLRWKPEEFSTQCTLCNGCGSCRTEATAQRMCPTFRVDHSEAATPRAKANLLRALLDGSLSVEQLTTQEVRKVADLCINCRMCAQECPAEVNIPKLMLEVKAQHVAEEGMTWTEWAMGNVENLAAWASRFAWFVNLVMHDCSARWLIQRLFGLAARRRLPKLAPVHFLRLAQRRGWTAKPLGNNRPRVAYFVDFFANYFEPAIALATVEVLHHQGIEVYVPPGQVGCGMAPLAHGLVERARRMAMQNINVFADLARAGYTIICSEPTAALMLKHDYLYLVDDPDVALVAEQTIELTHYLAKLHDQGRLISNFQPLDLTVGHHTPCHLKALGHPAAAPQLLEKIPQLRILPVGLSCSGMAGTFGLEEKNMEVALRAGQPMLERLGHGDIHVGTSECSSCRLQMAMTGIPVVHPVQLLARAFKASGGRKSSDFF